MSTFCLDAESSVPSFPLSPQGDVTMSRAYSSGLSAYSVQMDKNSVPFNSESSSQFGYGDSSIKVNATGSQLLPEQPSNVPRKNAQNSPNNLALVDRSIMQCTDRQLQTTKAINFPIRSLVTKNAAISLSQYYGSTPVAKSDDDDKNSFHKCKKLTLRKYMTCDFPFDFYNYIVRHGDFLWECEDVLEHGFKPLSDAFYPIEWKELHEFSADMPSCPRYTRPYRVNNKVKPKETAASYYPFTYRVSQKDPPVFLARSICGNVHPFIRNVWSNFSHDIRTGRTLRHASIKAGRSKISNRDRYSSLGIPDLGLPSSVLRAGNSHHTSVARLRALTLLSPLDICVDIGHGDGTMAIHIAATSGCHVHGVEVAHDRYEVSQKVLSAVLEQAHEGWDIFSYPLGEYDNRFADLTSGINRRTKRRREEYPSLFNTLLQKFSDPSSEELFEVNGEEESMLSRSWLRESREYPYRCKKLDKRKRPSQRHWTMQETKVPVASASSQGIKVHTDSRLHAGGNVTPPADTAGLSPIWQLFDRASYSEIPNTVPEFRMPDNPCIGCCATVLIARGLVSVANELGIAHDMRCVYYTPPRTVRSKFHSTQSMSAQRNGYDSQEYNPPHQHVQMLLQFPDKIIDVRKRRGRRWGRSYWTSLGRLSPVTGCRKFDSYRPCPEKEEKWWLENESMKSPAELLRNYFLSPRAREEQMKRTSRSEKPQHATSTSQSSNHATDAYSRVRKGLHYEAELQKSEEKQANQTLAPSWLQNQGSNYFHSHHFPKEYDHGSTGQAFESHGGVLLHNTQDKARKLPPLDINSTQQIYENFRNAPRLTGTGSRTSWLVSSQFGQDSQSPPLSQNYDLMSYFPGHTYSREQYQYMNVSPEDEIKRVCTPYKIAAVGRSGRPTISQHLVCRLPLWDTPSPDLLLIASIAASIPCLQTPIPPLHPAHIFPYDTPYWLQRRPAERRDANRGKEHLSPQANSRPSHAAVAPYTPNSSSAHGVQPFAHHFSSIHNDTSTPQNTTSTAPSPMVSSDSDPGCPLSSTTPTMKTPAPPTISLTPLRDRLTFLEGDARAILADPNHPIRRARVVYCNNFQASWEANGFQAEVLSLLARVMPRGSLLVSTSPFLSKRHSREGGHAISKQLDSQLRARLDRLRNCPNAYADSRHHMDDSLAKTNADDACYANSVTQNSPGNSIASDKSHSFDPEEISMGRSSTNVSPLGEPLDMSEGSTPYTSDEAQKKFSRLEYAYTPQEIEELLRGSLRGSLVDNAFVYNNSGQISEIKLSQKYFTPQLYVEVSGGWPENVPLELDTYDASAHKYPPILSNFTMFDIVEQTFIRGRALPEYDAVSAIIRMKQMCVADDVFGPPLMTRLEPEQGAKVWTKVDNTVSFNRKRGRS